ncbi:UDP-N-acetylglucosamine 1-carboxyvinyltransferase [Verrucomicrobium sp. BvORR034]|uniref:UDP-N-acetylglucosamine 1-carboxyvinyltransferase n=1 Tax=Verrucomicrobium sp. BvORR034 TaxID=1396418 RepID=UPI0006786598|nr:UDP-N-acetylglucosamine 1-carboxyvinyltransferase [Verrucomicrobium sp. BvORR034]
MEKLIVHGGNRLRGKVLISGSKNSSLPILAATLLTKDDCVIRQVPDLSDTNYMLQILRALGAEVERASGTVNVKAEKIIPDTPYDLVRKMRASICVMGPLTGRLRKAVVSMPGGCVIGDRPVDLHLKGLEYLGAKVQMDGGNIHIEAKKPLKGCTMNLLGKFGSTVLGTDNVLMAAVLTKGTTIIEGAAAEPEVEDLANFLIKMGAKIEGAGSTRIVVEGVKELHGAEHTVIPDRIEAGTFLVAGAIFGDGVMVKRVVPAHLKNVTDTLLASGYEVTSTKDSVTIMPGSGAPKGFHLTTRVYPGFPTDMQAQFCALACLIPGLSSIKETIFPQRFMHVSELKRMGANIELDGDTARITGVETLSGAPVMASDLRASAALVLAGLAAKGTTEIHRLYHIDRGYEHLDEKLSMLGAVTERVKE